MEKLINPTRSLKSSKSISEAKENTKNNKSKREPAHSVLGRSPLKDINLPAKSGNVSSKSMVLSKRPLCKRYLPAGLPTNNKNYKNSIDESTRINSLPAPSIVPAPSLAPASQNIKKHTAENKRNIKNKLTDKILGKRPLRDPKTAAKSGDVNSKSNVSSKNILCKISTPQRIAPLLKLSISKKLTNTATKVMKYWCPPPAHSGVPVPEKMKKLILKLKKVRRSSIKTSENTMTSDSENTPPGDEVEKCHLKDGESPSKTGKVTQKSTKECIISSKADLPKLPNSKKLSNCARKPMNIWKPLPAHSGVPVPEKMKKLSLKLLDLAFYKNELF